MADINIILMIAVISAVTIILRSLPFLVFGGSRETPKYVMYLGEVLPYAIMGMLVVYCLRNVSVVSSPYGIPEITACMLVAGLHIWKRNSLLSIGCGTVCYMLLLQFVF